MKNLLDVPTSSSSSFLVDPNSIPQNSVTQRLLKDLAKFVDSDKNTNFCFEDDGIADIFIWRIKITGPAQTLCEGHNFVVQFEFTEDWPFKPPNLTFIGEKIPAHPYVNSDGIILSPFYEYWSTDFTIEKICHCISAFILADADITERGTFNRPTENNLKEDIINAMENLTLTQGTFNNAYEILSEEYQTSSNTVGSYEQALEQLDLARQEFNRALDDVDLLLTKVEIIEKMEKDTEDLKNEQQKLTTMLRKAKAKANDELIQATKELQEKQNERLENFEKMQKTIKEEFEENLFELPENIFITIQTAKEYLSIDSDNYYNFAFAGHTNAGKSTLINALRGITGSDPQSAPVDNLECTEVVSCYTFPNGEFPYVRLYDMPGSGTMRQQSKTYYQEQRLCAFDVLIILTQETLCEEEISYAMMAKQYNQIVVFVRSKCDVDLISLLQNNELKKPTQKDADDLVQRLSEAFSKEIQEKAPEALRRMPCFFIAAPSLRKIVNKEPAEFTFQESQFIDFMIMQSKYDRNIVRE